MRAWTAWWNKGEMKGIHPVFSASWMLEMTVTLSNSQGCKGTLLIDCQTEIARTDIARPSKLWGLTSRDWTTRDRPIIMNFIYQFVLVFFAICAY